MQLVQLLMILRQRTDPIGAGQARREYLVGLSMILLGEQTMALLSALVKGCLVVVEDD